MKVTYPSTTQLSCTHKHENIENMAARDKCSAFVTEAECTASTSSECKWNIYLPTVETGNSNMQCNDNTDTVNRVFNYGTGDPLLSLE